jgi:TRAP-type C4-dicarboxylate transport system permease small subunit
MRSSFLALYAAYGRLMSWFAVIAGAILFALMWLICANSISRKLLNAPIVGTLEITEALMPFVILLPMAFTQFRDGHIRVTLITDRLPRKLQTWLHVATLIIAAVFFAWVAYATLGFALRAFRISETAWGVIRIPLWPSKGVITAGAVLLAIQYLLDAVRILLLGAIDRESEVTARVDPEQEAVHG